MPPNIARPSGAGWARGLRRLPGLRLPLSARTLSSSPRRQSSRSPDLPFRLAVVGSGPAGFYTSYRVMGKIPGARVDMYESLPVPFGLVRHGVAPDHPEVKNCQEKFDEIASSPQFTFIGNVSVGHPGHSTQHCTVELKSLMRNYDAVLFSYGASEDKKLGIPGESTLKGIYSARHVVGWYNGLPDCSTLDLDLTRGEEAIIIGQGNVALDVARMLLEDIDVLNKTDITEHALAKLADSRVKRVHIVGRRGPMQAAFTIKEIRELMKLPQVSFHPFNRSLIPAELKSLPRATRRLMEVLVSGSPTPHGTAPKSWSLDSCLSPKRFLGNPESALNVGSTEFDVTELFSPFDPQSSVESTGETVVLSSDIVFRSVGYKSVPLPGFDDFGFQFDSRRGILCNDGLGRAIGLVSNTDDEDAKNQIVPGVYCAGWVKTGPTGVIASTMQDAFITGDAIAADWLSGAPFRATSSEHIMSGWETVRKDADSSNGRAVAWDDWRKIDQAERKRGQKVGKKREKFTSTADMLAVLG
ncbi:hypothetical protein B0J13DRAFT_70193 [Dactylonectria estremocensis]|uniref:NADPH:adrenodoxin oxidoreductase, mitochondrial n=1 Tax=Dactylonectria estremocensis TaxID=1079267 RepID=A0A9P9ECY8_9HYPO|nr:hypothetical protein B0J13DRAFT_70193 [Dactylonectria estremocensis]